MPHKVERFHEIQFQRALAHLFGDVVLCDPGGAHNGYEQYAQHPVGRHALHVHAESVGTLPVEDGPEGVVGVHHDKEARRDEPKIEPVDPGVVESGTDECILNL